jgi:hypothetical protein
MEASNERFSAADYISRDTSSVHARTRELNSRLKPRNWLEPKTRKSKAPVPVIAPLRKILDAYRTKCGNPTSGDNVRFGEGEHRCA